MLTAAVLIAALAAGCSSAGRTYSVEGEVTWNGAPVPDGFINFVPADGLTTPVSAKITKGRYAASVPPGRMRIEIDAQHEGPKDPVMGQAKRESYIPPKYNAESTLVRDVQPHNGNKLDFHLPETR